MTHRPSSTFNIRAMRRREYRETAELITTTFNRYKKSVRRGMRLSASGKKPGRRKRHAKTLVAVFNGRVIGAVQCHYVPPRDGDKIDRTPMYVIAWLSVARDQRKKGAGRALVKAAERHIRKDLAGRNGMIYLLDGIRRKRPGTKFYERLGFTDALPWFRKSRNGDPPMVKWIGRGARP